MSCRDVKLSSLLATIAEMRGTFQTKDVSSHPDMLRAHPELSLLAQAMKAGLQLPGGLHLVCQEWRLPVASGRGDKLDLLAVDLGARALVVIELKRSWEATQKVDRHGRDAEEQAEHYAELLYEHRQVLYPFFERVARALARHHDGPEAMRSQSLDPGHHPRAIV